MLVCPGCGERLAYVRPERIRWLAPIEVADRKLRWVEIRCHGCSRRWHFAPQARTLREVRA